MAPYSLASIALALTVLLAAPATASEKADAKKPTADGHKPAAAAGRPKGTHASGPGSDHESKSVAKGDHAEHGVKAKPKGPADHDDHGSKAAAQKAAPPAEKAPKSRAHGAGARAEEHDDAKGDDHGAHKDDSDAPRRVRGASGAELRAVTQRIKDKIVEIPRFRAAPARPAPIVHARPAPKTELVWRQGLSWPPSLDAAWESPFADGDLSVNLSWAMDDRCAAPARDPDLPSSSWSSVAGLAPSRCCGLFLTK